MTRQKNILKSALTKLKHSKSDNHVCSVSFKGKILCLTPITYRHVTSKKHISMLARWRDRNKQWFPTVFRVTHEGTRLWLKEKVLDDPDRILFFIHFKGEEPFAHAGFDRWEDSGSWAIDNVLRGRTPKGSKGAMKVALGAMMEWAYDTFNFRVLTLTVFDDNIRAIKMYVDLGFRRIRKEPLVEKTENGVTVWEAAESTSSAQRFHLYMEHRKQHEKNSARYGNLERIAADVRKDILMMSYRANSAHTGGALSVVEILVSLYFSVMHVDPKHPEDPKRDRLIFSKAHDAKALYAVLAAKGYFLKKILEGYESDGGRLPGHSTRHCVPGVEVSAGSLGHGLPMAAGSAWAIKAKGHRVFAILSDGECDEGSTWEAALFAAHNHLDNLTAIVDYNKLQGYGFTKDVLNLEPFVNKWTSFGWEVREVNGHDFTELIPVLATIPFMNNKPSVIIAHTIKGIGGVSKHMNQVSSQYKPPTREELEEVLGRLV